MEVAFQNVDNQRPPWRLKTQLLSNEHFVNFVLSQIDFFMITNRTPNISASTLWETLKAYIRGEIISYTAHENKLKRHRLSMLTRCIAQLDDIYAVSPSPDIYKERLTLQAEFDTLLTDQVTEMLVKSRSTYYEQGDKASKLLAHKLRQLSSSSQITKIRTSSGISLDPGGINEEFKRFYQSLYTSESKADTLELDDFFHSLSVPSVGRDLVKKLEQPITVEELSNAVKSLQSGRSPGPDGYSTEFYKKFISKIAPILIEMYNDAFVNGALPHTLTQATICVILKKNKDPLDCASYRPISLLNVDYKILAKILATRLETVLPSIISPDQTGFIKNRHSFFNLRRLFNIIYNPSVDNTSEAIISLDAEKAFDRVEWKYLFYTLNKFGFGSKFMTWIKLLYSSPQASVRTNNTQSDRFPLQRSTRQGCPLSPLLFALAIEPLAIALRSNPLIKGIVRYGHEHKLSLYADDLLIYTSNLSVSVPAALATFASFGHLSGYKLNLSKSELMPLNMAAKKSPLHNLPFKIAHSSFIYLGVYVTIRFENLFQANFAPLLTRTKDDLERWSLLHLSLVARNNSIKMNTLPKFLYLYQCLPIFLPNTFFKKIDGLILPFIWDKKPPR
uniref:Reverse transcriptase domain-containing protein n=1 Tax=Hucho hucho TaxID=62062 RepID=A0A4W5RYX9_9TELE